MGIHDRDYVRAEPRRPAPLRLSVVQWLVIINVAVFALQMALLPNVQVTMGKEFVQGTDQQTIRESRVVRGVTTTTPEGMPAHPIVDRNNTPIGFQRFRAMRLPDAVGHFSTGKAFAELQIWRFVTFQFLHAGLLHLFLNMFGLWIFGPLVERHLGSGRLFLAFYLACGVFGAATYLVLNLFGHFLGGAPGLLFHDPYVPLVGASAGVFGVLLACAYLAGNARILVFFVLPMKMSTAAYLFVALAAFNLFAGGGNAGGDAAHLGGAAAGALLIRKPHLLLDFFDEFLAFGRRGKKSRRSGGLGGAVAARPGEDRRRAGQGPPPGRAEPHRQGAPPAEPGQRRASAVGLTRG